MNYRSQAFDPERHDVATFSCGEPSLGTWLQEQAASATARRTARTWVWTDEADVVVGYYALAAHRISRGEVPARVGRGGPVEIPAVLLARLAFSEQLRGKDLGEVLLAGALGRIVEASRTVAARLVVVDALHEKVAGFYERLGFRRIPKSLLLVQKVSDIQMALEHNP